MKRIAKNLLAHFGHFLQKGASVEEIKELERAIGVAMPSDLVELYQVHNGEASNVPGLFFGMRFLPLSEILSEWQAASEHSMAERQFTEIAADGANFNSKWIPFAADPNGNLLVMDMDPGKKESPDQVIGFSRDGQTQIVVARNVQELMEFLSRSIQEGCYAIGGETWSYGAASQVTFLDALKEIPLPVLYPTSEEVDAETRLPRRPESSVLGEVTETVYADGQAVKQILPPANSDSIPVTGSGHLDRVNRLTVSIFSIEQLTAVATAPQLEHLHIRLLAGVAPPDLAVFSEMENLQSLTIEGCDFYDLVFLTRIYKLKQLRFIDCAIADGSAINEMPVEILELHYTSIDNLEVISESPSLQVFSGSFQQFQKLQPEMTRPVDFSRITGDMTDMEKTSWINHLEKK